VFVSQAFGSAVSASAASVGAHAPWHGQAAEDALAGDALLLRLGSGSSDPLLSDFLTVQTTPFSNSPHDADIRTPSLIPHRGVHR
jgi:hypothetical protein